MECLGIPEVMLTDFRVKLSRTLIKIVLPAIMKGSTCPTSECEGKGSSFLHSESRVRDMVVIYDAWVIGRCMGDRCLSSCQ